MCCTNLSVTAVWLLPVSPLGSFVKSQCVNEPRERCTAEMYDLFCCSAPKSFIYFSYFICEAAIFLLIRLTYMFKLPPAVDSGAVLNALVREVMHNVNPGSSEGKGENVLQRYDLTVSTTHIRLLVLCQMCSVTTLACKPWKMWKGKKKKIAIQSTAGIVPARQAPCFPANGFRLLPPLMSKLISPIWENVWQRANDVLTLRILLFWHTIVTDKESAVGLKEMHSVSDYQKKIII